MPLGSAAGDLDNDGTLEIVISNMGARPSVLKNFGRTKNWLLVQCVGTKANRDAIGARVYVSVDGRRLSGEIQSGSGFISHNDSRVHFGLADNVSYDRIDVQWPGESGKSSRAGRATGSCGSSRAHRGHDAAGCSEQGCPWPFTDADRSETVW
jgi:hypothetical protein